MDSARILITGSEGLIGACLRPLLIERGAVVRGFDPRAERFDERGDVRVVKEVAGAVSKCSGIVVLGAISRVIWGERDPDACRATNVGGLLNVLAAATASPMRPWIVFASSREVYGEPRALPVREDAPLAPVNVYGRTKIEGERLVEAAGLPHAIVRLSNVYGSPLDHVDRVVPAFVRGALAGAPLRVDGPENSFDFTYVNDVADGIARVIDCLSAERRPLPPIHFVSGIETTLGELASRVVTHAGSPSTVTIAPPRNFDVSRFVGDPARARELLGWVPRTPLDDGLQRLITSSRRYVAAGGAP